MNNIINIIETGSTSKIRLDPILKSHCDVLSEHNMDIVTKIKTLPSTRYYGSKLRLLNWLYDNLSCYDFNTALDAFGGTASVSLLFKAMGKTVSFNDALQSNCVSAKALLSNSLPLDLATANSFIESIKPVTGFVSRNFKGMYYTDFENKWIDGAVQQINDLKCEITKNALLYCLFQSCLQKRPFNLFHRANLNLRQNNNIERSFGNLSTWNKPFTKAMSEVYVSISNMVWHSGKQHVVLPPSDIFDVSANHDLVYLDPPYVDLSNRYDDYLRRYHFLEGLCVYDKWGNYIDYSTHNNSMISLPYIRDWHKKSRVRDMLFALIDKHHKSVVALSYIDNAYPTKAELLSYFKSRFSKVRILHHELNHALAKSKKTELLLIGEP